RAPPCHRAAERHFRLGATCRAQGCASSVLVDADAQKVNAVNGLTAPTSGSYTADCSCPDLPTLMAVPSNEAPATAASGALTPAMRQYHEAKRQYRDAIVLFRMGDFYEMFFEDALVAARALDLTLTSRSKDASGGAIPMCGVPFHAVDGYLARLVRNGYRVAVCEQVEDPGKAKGVVRREVVRVVSPGTLLDQNYLDAREPAFLMSLGPDRGDAVGAALLDLTTGEFVTGEYTGPA